MQKAAALFGGVEIDPGFKLMDSRETEWEFVMVTKAPDIGGPSSGKVLVKRPCDHEKVDGECDGPYWCRGIEQREFFPSVVGLKLEPVVEGADK